MLRFLLAERMGFEPMCRVTDNRISSAARYDHFDTFPRKYLFFTRNYSIANAKRARAAWLFAIVKRTVFIIQ